MRRSQYCRRASSVAQGGGGRGPAAAGLERQRLRGWFWFWFCELYQQAIRVRHVCRARVRAPEAGGALDD